MLTNFVNPEVVELNCSKCKGKSFKKYNYMKSYPKYLIINVERLVLKDWVPKKSNALITLPDDSIELNILKLPKIGKEEV